MTTSEASASISNETKTFNEMIEFKNATKKTSHNTITQMERQLMHPLEVNDKLAFETIKTVRLDFITNEAKATVPR